MRCPGTHQIQGIIFYIMKTLLPSTEYNRIGIGRDIMGQPRNMPSHMQQAINWIEDFYDT
eukprot:1691270-Amphidinium_carterae.3